MAKIEIDPINSQFASQQGLNRRFQQIEDELNNKVLYRDSPEGEVNQMEDELDMNQNAIINLPKPVLPQSPVRLVDLENFSGGEGPNAGTLVVNEEQVEMVNGQTVVVFSFDLEDAEVYLTSNNVGRGKLFLNDDFTVAGSTLTLAESWPNATKIVARVQYIIAI